MVRERSEAPTEGGSARDTFRRRCRTELSISGGCRKGDGGLTEAVREIRFDAPPGKDATAGIRTICRGECEEAGKETGHLRLSRPNARLCPQPEGKVHGARANDEEAAPTGPEGDRRLVPGEPTRACGGATENP